MADGVRFAIRGETDGRRIEMPEGSQRTGAVRHAQEYAAETDQVVMVEASDDTTDEDGWRDLVGVDPAQWRRDLDQSITAIGGAAERAAVVAFLRGMDLHRLAERIENGEHRA